MNPQFDHSYWFYGRCFLALALSGISAYYLGVRKGHKRGNVDTAVAPRGNVEEAVMPSDDQFAKAFHAGPAAMNISALDTGCILDVNDGFLKLFGFERGEVIGRTGAELKIWGSLEDRKKFFASLWETGSVRNQQSRFCTKAGRSFDSLISAEAINFCGNECLLSVILDVSEQMRLEEQLRRAQRMEAVGTLSGGIAHDFNNLLTVIRGYSHILLDALKNDPELRSSVERIDEAAGKAASLTRQLLAFSRQQVLEPKVFNLNALVVNLESMLRRLIGENIEIRVMAAPELGPLKADPSQIEHAIMNLAVNARDAMPEGGKLTLETANVILDDDYAKQHVGAKAGPHVMLSVTDTGVGMDDETLRHIFEPFFTTKGPGQGTGLGLSMVYGIVKQSGGSIWAYSEPGKGTTFKMYLPQVETAIQSASEEPQPPADLFGTETILLVEDDSGVRQLARTVLTSAGYTVLAADNASHACSLSQTYSGPIHLLLTDVVMPGMGGRELAREIAGVKPQTRVLYMSGYAVSAIVHHGVLEANTFFLAKPLTPASLLLKVRQVLDKPR